MAELAGSPTEVTKAINSVPTGRRTATAQLRKARLQRHSVLLPEHLQVKKEFQVEETYGCQNDGDNKTQSVQVVETKLKIEAESVKPRRRGRPELKRVAVKTSFSIGEQKCEGRRIRQKKEFKDYCEVGIVKKSAAVDESGSVEDETAATAAAGAMTGKPASVKRGPKQKEQLYQFVPRFIPPGADLSSRPLFRKHRQKVIIPLHEADIAADLLAITGLCPPQKVKRSSCQSTFKRYPQGEWLR